MARYLIIVSGRVQGVGFRYFVQIIGNKLKLKGFVRNQSNGNVEIEAEGPEENLKKFLKEVKEGNGFSKISDICIKSIKIKENEKNFSITY